MSSNDHHSESVRAWHLAEEELRSRLGRQWPAGAWLPPMRDLAVILGSGQVNTQRAVASLARQGYLLSLRGKGTLVRRVPEAGRADGGASAAERRDRFALVYSLGTDPLVMRMVQACQRVLKPIAGRVELIGVGHQSSPVSLGERFDGMVMFSPGAWMQAMGDAAQHCVTVAPWQAEWQADRSAMDSVSVDQEHGGELAGRLMRRLGCELGCFVGKSDNDGAYDATSRARLRGFERGMGQTIDSDRQMFGRFYGPLTGSHAFRCWQKLRPRPQAVFAVSDEIAVGFLMAALSHGLEPGKDFQLVGFDGQDRGKLPEATLTTIEVPAAAMGTLAARLLLQRREDSTLPIVQLSLRPRLFFGQTTANPDGAAGLEQSSSHSSESHGASS